MLCHPLAGTLNETWCAPTPPGVMASLGGEALREWGHLEPTV